MPLPFFVKPSSTESVSDLSHLGWQWMYPSRYGVHGHLDFRTPEDGEKLKKLEQKLAELELVTNPKLEALCSRSCRPHFEEPVHMQLLPAPEDFGGDEIIRLAKYWTKEHKRQRQSKRKVQQREKDNTETR